MVSQYETINSVCANLAVRSSPALVAGALLGVRVPVAVLAAPGQTLLGRGVHPVALRPQPALATDALARHTEAVARAGGVRTVRLQAELPLQATVSRQGGQVVAHLVTLHTETLAVLAVAVPGAVRHLHTTSAVLATAWAYTLARVTTPPAPILG